MDHIMNITCIGVGNMGGAVARRLATSNDFAVTVFDPCTDAMDRCVAAGATSAPSLAAAVAEADALLTSLPTSKLGIDTVHEMANVAILAEGLAIAMRAGIKPDQFAQAIADTGAKSFQSEVRLPWMIDTEEEVLARANDTEMGLAGNVYTKDQARVWRFADRLDVGIIGVNDPLPTVVFAPMGGTKQSGLGREGGEHGLEEFQETRYLAIAI
jgi:3-hydroxyisobutyrate dehydrogenase-like beta-hydroxyacid dehydrogenase